MAAVDPFITIFWHFKIKVIQQIKKKKLIRGRQKNNWSLKQPATIPVFGKNGKNKLELLWMWTIFGFTAIAQEGGGG